MDKLNFVKEKLADKGIYKELAFATKISERTFYNILGGKRKTRQSIIDVLFEYLNRREK